jgi:hypothetical protein
LYRDNLLSTMMMERGKTKKKCNCVVSIHESKSPSKCAIAGKIFVMYENRYLIPPV